MEINYLSLTLGFLASIFFMVACFSIKRSHILLLGLLASTLFMACYITKADFLAAAIVVTAIMRNSLFMMEEKQIWRWLTRKRVMKILAIIVIIAWSSTIILGGWKWPALLILASPLILLYGLSLDNVLHLKFFSFLNGLGWLIYELLTGAYTVMIGEVVGLTMVVLAILRLVHKTKVSSREENGKIKELEKAAKSSKTD